MDDIIRPHVYIALRLPSDTLKIVRAQPNTTITIGKYGSFDVNNIIGRPYYLTFEISDQAARTCGSSLRVVTALEQHADVNEEAADPSKAGAEWTGKNTLDGVEYEVVSPEGKVVMRTNRETIDDTARQKLSMSEIEALKREETGSGKELIAKILESHSALDQKTSFGLAKYTLRKAKKYLRRFTVLPLDVTLLANWILYEKEPAKIMEIREEILAIICSWSNVHYGLQSPSLPREFGKRWLVVDETGGLIIAAMAERMGILYPREDSEVIPFQNGASVPQPAGSAEEPLNITSGSAEMQNTMMSAETNTITLIHANTQPNLSLLTYFDFDLASPLLSHPLYSHLKTLSWLQLLSPYEDSTYTEPDVIPDEELANFKSGKKTNYHRKRRRWERVKSVVDETRAGGFDGLVIASVMNPTTILHQLVPLLRGAAQVIVYSPNIEPLVELADYYSSARRAAYLTDPPNELPSADFPLNPTLLLTPAIHTVRCRPWQVLPGRTHPLMTGRGGAEGYVFVGTRVIPVDGKVEARGQFKRRKIAETTATSPAGDQVNRANQGDNADMIGTNTFTA